MEAQQLSSSFSLQVPVAPEMQLSQNQSQTVIDGLEELVSGHQQPSPSQIIETGLGYAATEIVVSSGAVALVDAPEELQNQVGNEARVCFFTQFHHNENCCQRYLLCSNVVCLKDTASLCL